MSRSLLIQRPGDLPKAVPLQTHIKNAENNRGSHGVDFQDVLMFNQMIADARAGKINLILCKDLSRLGRDYIEAGRYTDIVFPSMGCRF